MMPQQEPSSYGRYEGQRQGYSQPPYETPTYEQAQPGGMYDDESIDLLAQRLSQRMAQGPVGKIQPTQKSREANGPLVLAVISVVLLVPLAVYLIGNIGGFYGLVAFGITCMAIFVINAVYAEYGKHVSKYR